MSSNMDEFFNIEEDKQQLEIKELEPIVHSNDIVKNTMDDYHSTRESMITMITHGTSMITDLMLVAKETESPRAYEVLSGYMKTITEMNKSLMELHKDTKELTQEKEQEVVKDQETYEYVGSTEDLQKELTNES